jgi:membrane fusion protein (multidrug efflux system)
MNRLVLGLAGAVCLCVLSGCGAAEKTADAAIEKDKKPAEVIIPVTVEKPLRGDISSYFETSARVEAERKVNVTAEAPGICVSVSKDEGQKVDAGDVLAELDKDSVQASYKQSEVQVRKNKADFERAKELAKDGLMSREQYDTVRFAYEQGVAALETQRVQLDKMTIRSPISGIVTQRNIQKGQLVTSGTPAFSVVDPDSYTVTIHPPEKDLQRLHNDQAANITIDALSGKEFVAHVRRINPAVDPVSGTVKVVLDFDPSIRRELRDSAFARVKLVLDTRKNILLVPKDAIVEENARRYVFTVEEAPAELVKLDTSALNDQEKDTLDGVPKEIPAPAADEPRRVAKRVEVQTGFEDSNSVEVTEGISDDSLIVTQGQFNLKPETPVRYTTIEGEMAKGREKTLEDALKEGREKRGDNPDVMSQRRRR